MVSNSMRRKSRRQWRYFLGLSVLGLLIIASASHARNRLPAMGGDVQVESSAGQTPGVLARALMRPTRGTA